MKHPERDEQRAILQLLQLVKAETWVLGTVRPRGDWPGTRQTAGICDILGFVSCHDGSTPRRLVAIEVKARGGRLGSAQIRFQQMCAEAGVDHIVGGVDEVIAWLMAQGLLPSKNMADDRPTRTLGTPTGK